MHILSREHKKSKAPHGRLPTVGFNTVLNLLPNCPEHGESWAIPSKNVFSIMAAVEKRHQGNTFFPKYFEDVRSAKQLKFVSFVLLHFGFVSKCHIVIDLIKIYYSFVTLNHNYF